MPVGWAAPPPPCRFCQLSAINADYCGPRPAPRTSLRWGVPLRVRPAQGTGEVAPSPRMVSDSQSAPIRAIGGRLKIRGHPAPRVGEFADRGGWPTTEGADLRRRPSSKGLRVRQVFLGGGFALGRGFLDLGTHPPRSLHRPRGPIGVGFGGSLLGETSSPSTLPSFSVLSGSSSALPPMSCLGIRVRGPGFPKPNPSRPEPIRVDRGFFEPPIVLDDGGGSSSPMPPLSRPSPWAASPLPPIRKSGEAVSHRLPIGAEADGVPIPGTLARRDRLSETHRVPLIRNPPASALPPMPLGGRRGLATRPSRHLDRPYGDGRPHRRPEPFETGLPEPFFAFSPFEGVDGRRSCPPPRLPFPGPWDPGNSEEAMIARRRDRSPCSNGAEGLPSGPPSRSYLHT